MVLPFARKAWADLQQSDTGVVRFDHDHYLEIWALTGPRIKAAFLLLDEAQDTNPVLEQVFSAQRDYAQLVMVGDSAQTVLDVLDGIGGVGVLAVGGLSPARTSTPSWTCVSEASRS